jgi:hypothetical protein
MDQLNKLCDIYNRWGNKNNFSPLPSADDLEFDYRCGNLKLNFNQFHWLQRFRVLWDQAENHVIKKGRTEGQKMYSLWEKYLINDKRGFEEFFSEEFGFTIDEAITYKQLKLLCEKLIGGKNG